ncbi:MAG: RidA family protein [Alphaproteobacteria bacterium]|nr:RidA family protein [Alphaproteobacteria bacterium]
MAKKLTHINPTSGIAPVLDYGLSHAVMAEGGRVVWISGQIAWDEKGNTIGKDLRTQVAQAHENIRRILASVGGKPADVVRMTTYVVNYRPEDGEVIVEANKKFFHGVGPAAQTLLGIQSLYAPDIRVEVECTAVLD